MNRGSARASTASCTCAFPMILTHLHMLELHRRNSPWDLTRKDCRQGLISLAVFGRLSGAGVAEEPGRRSPEVRPHRRLAALAAAPAVLGCSSPSAWRESGAGDPEDRIRPSPISSRSSNSRAYDRRTCLESIQALGAPKDKGSVVTSPDAPRRARSANGAAGGRSAADRDGTAPGPIRPAVGRQRRANRPRGRSRTSAEPGAGQRRPASIAAFGCGPVRPLPSP
jgi:hypothetical protein